MSSNRGYGGNSPTGGVASDGLSRVGVISGRDLVNGRDRQSSFGVEGSARNASFAESTSRQHTRDGFYSRQNSRIVDSRRGVGVANDSSRRLRRKPNAGVSPNGGCGEPTETDATAACSRPREIPLSEMSFWQRLELFKAAQRRAYADALGYAQLYKPRPLDTWMFGHRIHRAFVFSYFSGAEKNENQQPADRGSTEKEGKKKKKKRKKGAGKGNEMKSIFGSVLPQDFYPGGKMNIDGKYACDYNQISV